MKKFKTIFAILLTAILAISCSSDKDDKPTYKTENPLEAYYTATGFTTVSNFINSGVTNSDWYLRQQLKEK